MEGKLPSAFEKNQIWANLASYLILVAMMVCLSFSFLQLLQWLLPSWQWSNGITVRQLDCAWGLMPVAVLLVSLEAVFLRPLRRKAESAEKVIYLAAEWITFIVLLKITLYAVHGFDLLLLDLPRWQSSILSFFEGELLPYLFLIAICWFISQVAANYIEDLNTDPDDIYFEIGILQNSRLEIRNRLLSLLLWVGILLVILTAAIRTFYAHRVPEFTIQLPVLNVLVYFLLVMVLFSLTQYALLSGRWFWNQTEVHPLLARRWVRYSIIFFMLLAVVSFLLPTGYSIGLLETIGYILNFLFALVFMAVQLILAAFVWLISLAGCTRPLNENTVITPEPLPTPIATPMQNAAPLPWLQLLQSILFWVVFIGLIGYALVTFIRQNPQLFTLFQKLSSMRYLGKLFSWLRHWLNRASNQLVSSLNAVRQRLASRQHLRRQEPRWINFRQLSPRQQIIFYYLRLLKRGGDRGIVRQAHQTPCAYAERLESDLPDVTDDIVGITEAFLEARYSQHLIPSEKPSLVQRFWRNIAHSMENLKKQTPPETGKKP